LIDARGGKPKRLPGKSGNGLNSTMTCHHLMMLASQKTILFFLLLARLLRLTFPPCKNRQKLGLIARDQN